AMHLDALAGLDELYRKVLTTLRPTISAHEVKTRVQAFDIATPTQRIELVAQLFNSLLPARETALLVDTGGVLTDAGEFVPELNDLISKLDARPHPPAIFITPRMIPLRLRRPENDVSYVAVRSFNREDSERLISGLLKDRNIGVSDSTLGELV